MPLSPAVARDPLHVREVICNGYYRADGLWDIEGHLKDLKTYGFENEHRGHVEAGHPVHDMWIRLTLDDNFVVQAIEAVTDASPYSICSDITVNFARLKGAKIGPGWRREVRNRIGGVHGCTHLVELLAPLATTAYQTIQSAHARTLRGGRYVEDDPTEPEDRKGRRPRLINSCHAFGETSPVVARYWPDHYTGALRA